MSESGHISARNQRARRALLAIDDRCSYCGKRLTFRTSTADHIVARCWGGSDDPGNVALACRRCNKFKGDDPIESLVCPVVRGGRLRYVFSFLRKDKAMIPAKVSFNYDVLLVEQRELAKNSAGKIRDLMRLSANTIVEIGKLLTAVHGVLRDEHYQAWLKAEFGWNYTAAWHYESAAKHFGEAGEALENFQPGAIRLLCNGNVEKKAIKESLVRAERGEIITRNVATKIISRNLPAGRTDPALKRPLYSFRLALRQFNPEVLDALTKEEQAELLAGLLQLVEVVNAKLEQRKPISRGDRPNNEPGRPAPRSRKRALAIA